MQKKDSFISIIKGVITGIASLISGVSPASCIVSLSSYENFITGLSSIFKKEPNKKIKEENKKILLLVTISIFIGIVLGLLAGGNLINYFIGKYRSQTIFLFVGMITGGLTLIIKNKKITNIKKQIPVFVISLVLVFSLYFLLMNYDISIPKGVLPIASGFITSLMILVPGISLSYVYILLDKYSYIVSFSLSNIKDVLVVLMFVVVFILSLVLIAKLISILLNKYKEKCYSVICSLLILSIVAMILEVGKFTVSFVNIFTTILAFLWGYLLAKNIEKE